MAQKAIFWETSYKIFQFHRKKGARRIKMAFWAFKSQNFEKVYKIKNKNHAILHLIQ